MADSPLCWLPAAWAITCTQYMPWIVAGDAPVIGWPTYPGIDQSGKEIQWVQCQECFKWRKVPGDALLPSRWVCSDNRWDAGRSLCSAAEESKDQLEKDCHPHVCFVAEDEAECVVPDSTAKHPSHISVERKEKDRCDRRSESSSVSSICDKMLGDGTDGDNANKWHYLDEVADRRRIQHKSQIDLNIKPDHREDDVQQHSTYSKCSFAGEDRFMNASDIVVVNQDVSCSSNLV
ncbi:hypothetical protein M569_06462 [Genlisea aurea]|uniref:CW-type domain-containing protein n=1 Tax=Genlisea aurea TaxID=192259 RepID=S8CMC7_9LAMI|nr:hypothetical protein M569_06462 [Genlisea aurea]